MDQNRQDEARQKSQRAIAAAHKIAELMEKQERLQRKRAKLQRDLDEEVEISRLKRKRAKRLALRYGKHGDAGKNIEEVNQVKGGYVDEAAGENGGAKENEGAGGPDASCTPERPGGSGLSRGDELDAERREVKRRLNF